MVKFNPDFGHVFRLPNRGKLSKNYLQKCKKGQDRFKPKNNSKKKRVTKKTGWWFKVNKRTIRKKTKRPQCY
jgi:hypothetical protein